MWDCGKVSFTNGPLGMDSYNFCNNIKFSDNYRTRLPKLKSINAKN